MNRSLDHLHRKARRTQRKLARGLADLADTLLDPPPNLEPALIPVRSDEPSLQPSADRRGW